jgi:hypothetical protein
MYTIENKNKSMKKEGRKNEWKKDIKGERKEGRKNGIQYPTAFLVPELEMPALALVSTFNGFFSKLATYDDNCCSVAVSGKCVEKKMYY